jgi:hypothetical protein
LWGYSVHMACHLQRPPSLHPIFRFSFVRKIPVIWSTSSVPATTSHIHALNSCRLLPCAIFLRTWTSPLIPSQGCVHLFFLFTAWTLASIEGNHQVVSEAPCCATFLPSVSQVSDTPRVPDIGCNEREPYIQGQLVVTSGRSCYGQR